MMNFYLQIEQTVSGNLFYQSEKKCFIIRTNADMVNWSYRNYWNEIAGSDSAEVLNGKAEIEADSSEAGWFTLLVQGISEERIVCFGATTFAVLSDFDLGKVTDSPFMVQTHAAREDEIAQNSAELLPIARKLGTKYVRDCFRWQNIEERKKGIYEFKEYHDSFLQKLKENDLLLYATFAKTNTFYDGNLSPNSEEGREAFAGYCVAVLKRNPEMIRYAEIWNEPELASMTPGIDSKKRKEFYLDLLKTVYAAIKKEEISIPIVGGVITDQDAGVALMEYVFQNGGNNVMDRFSFHNYFQLTQPFLSRINTYYEILKQNCGGSLPLDMTEFGHSTYTGETQMPEQCQAEELPVKIIYALANGVEKVSFYNLQDKGTDKEDKEANFGLIRHPASEMGAYTPKPAFCAYAALIRCLTGMKYDKTESWSAQFHSYVFRKESLEIRAIWTKTGAMSVLLTTQEREIEVTDIMGRVRKYPVNTNTVILPIASTIAYVRGTITGISII